MLPKIKQFQKILAIEKKINFAYILNLGRPLCETNHWLLSLAKYRFVSEKIDNN